LLCGADTDVIANTISADESDEVREVASWIAVIPSFGDLRYKSIKSLFPKFNAPGFIRSITTSVPEKRGPT